MKNMHVFTEGLHKYIKDAFKPVCERIDRLEARIATLESHLKEFTYKGVYSNDGRYVRGNFVTFNGNLWVCDAALATGRPPGQGWKLAVRAGRDAR